METYNGWKNRQTWNVALWISKDEALYSAAVQHVRKWKAQKRAAKGVYFEFAWDTALRFEKTPDGVSYEDDKLDYEALDKMMMDLVD